MSKPVVTAVAAVVSLLALAPAPARAHCDTLDGPVVITARKALETGKLNPVLAWVRPQDEAEIKAAFARTVAVRKAGREARELADTWFFETLVRVHRAGEGAPYTGLRPAGQDLGPAVRAADAAVASGSPAELEKLLVASVKEGLHERFAPVKARKQPGEDVAAGRAWVASYVPFVHWVEAVHGAAEGAGAHGEHAAPHAEHAEPHGERSHAEHEKGHAEHDAAEHEKAHAEHRAPAGGHAH
ncbi:MAG TPA: DUF6448 family protein [Anaeromyxobacter sp.]|nr:DUF6448 family protein [Anaeromyxobacter sp.]